MQDTEVARGLGVASIGLGLMEMLATRSLTKFMGLRSREDGWILRLLGLREILQGVDILAHDDPTPGMHARVWGDVLDLAVLGKAALKTRRPGGLLTAVLMVLGISLMDVAVAGKLASHPA